MFWCELGHIVDCIIDHHPKVLWNIMFGNFLDRYVACHGDVFQLLRVWLASCQLIPNTSTEQERKRERVEYVYIKWDGIVLDYLHRCGVGSTGCTHIPIYGAGKSLRGKARRTGEQGELSERARILGSVALGKQSSQFPLV